MESASRSRSRNNLGRMRCDSLRTVADILRRIRDNPEIMADRRSYRDAVRSTFGLKHLLPFIFTVSVVRPRVPFDLLLDFAFLKLSYHEKR